MSDVRLDEIAFYCTRHGDVAYCEVHWWDEFRVHVHTGCGDSVLPRGMSRWTVRNLELALTAVGTDTPGARIFAESDPTPDKGGTE